MYFVFQLFVVEVGCRPAIRPKPRGDSHADSNSKRAQQVGNTDRP